jgi:hypothetical protein
MIIHTINTACIHKDEEDDDGDNDVDDDDSRIQ